MIRQTCADHRLDAATLAEVRRCFERHQGADGARFDQPTHVRRLRRAG